MAGYKVYQANVNVFRCFIHVLLFDHIIKSCHGITNTTNTNTPARLTFEANCSYTTQCLSTLVCLDSGHCGCDSYNYKTENETCEPRLTFEDNCSNTTQCFSTLVCLDNGHCGCDSHSYKTEYETCEPKVGYNDPCQNKDGCLSNLICGPTIPGQCGCTSDQFYDSTNKLCAAKLPYGADCSAYTPPDSNVCKVTNTQCLKVQNQNRYFCLCDSNHYKKPDNSCGEVGDLKVVLASYPTTTSTVDFTWTTPNDMTGVSYSMKLTPSEGTVDTPNASGGMVSGLTPGKNYNVKIVSKLESDAFYSERTANVEQEIWMKPAKPGKVYSVQSETQSIYAIQFGPSNGIVASYRITVNGERQTTIIPSANFNTLTAGQSYNYSIFAFNGKNPINDISEERTGRLDTPPKGAGPVSNLNVTNVTSHSAQVEWKKPKDTNGNITGYQIILKRQDECVASYQVQCSDCGAANFTVPTGCTFNGKKEYSYTSFVNPNYIFTFDLSELKPYINYRVIVSAINEKGAGHMKMEDFQTLAAAPFNIENVVVEPTDRYPEKGAGLKISWTPGNFTGPTAYNILIEEQINLSGTDYNLTDEIHVSGYENTTYTKYGLLAYWKYTVSVMARTTENDKTVGESIWSKAAVVTTSTDVPGLVQNFDIEQDSIIAEKLTLAISCPPERQRNGKIEGYTIRKTQNLNTFEYNVSITSCLQESVFTEKDVGGIFVEKNYSFEVKVRNTDYIGQYSQRKMLNVEPKGPSLATRYPPRRLIHSPVESTEHEAKIDISICASCLIDKSQGTVKGVGLRVCVTEDDKSCIGAGQKNKRAAAIDSLESDSTWAQAKDEGFVSQYRATPTNWHKILPNKPDYLYTVGNNETCGSAVGDYCNGPLPAGKKFLISVVVCNEAGCDDTDGVFVTKGSSEDGDLGLIIGLTLGCIAIVVILVLGILVWHRVWRRSKKATTDDNGYGNFELPQTDSLTHQYMNTGMGIPNNVSVPSEPLENCASGNKQPYDPYITEGNDYDSISDGLTEDQDGKVVLQLEKSPYENENENMYENEAAKGQGKANPYQNDFRLDGHVAPYSNIF